MPKLDPFCVILATDFARAEKNMRPFIVLAFCLSVCSAQPKTAVPSTPKASPKATTGSAATSPPALTTYGYSAVNASGNSTTPGQSGGPPGGYYYFNAPPYPAPATGFWVPCSASQAGASLGLGSCTYFPSAASPVAPASTVSSSLQTGVNQSSNVTFNKNGSVTAQNVSSGTPLAVDFNRQAQAAGTNLLSALDQLQTDGKALAQSLAAAMDTKLATAPFDPLKQGAREISTNPIPGGLQGIVPNPIPSALVNSLIYTVDHLGVDQNALATPAQQALFGLDNAMNPFNLRKGLYEYSRGMIDAMVKALDLFLPPSVNQ